MVLPPPLPPPPPARSGPGPPLPAAAGPPWLRELLERMRRRLRELRCPPRVRGRYLGHVRRFYRARGRPGPVTGAELARYLRALRRCGRGPGEEVEVRLALGFLHRHVLGTPAPSGPEGTEPVEVAATSGGTGRLPEPPAPGPPARRPPVRPPGRQARPPSDRMFDDHEP